VITADGLPSGVGDLVWVQAENDRHNLGCCTQKYT
jgi:hypothetical protein